MNCFQRWDTDLSLQCPLHSRCHITRAQPMPKLTTPAKVWLPPTSTVRGPPLSPCLMIMLEQEWYWLIAQPDDLSLIFGFLCQYPDDSRNIVQQCARMILVDQECWWHAWTVLLTWSYSLMVGLCEGPWKQDDDDGERYLNDKVVYPTSVFSPLSSSAQHHLGDRNTFWSFRNIGSMDLGSDRSSLALNLTLPTHRKSVIKNPPKLPTRLPLTHLLS